MLPDGFETWPKELQEKVKREQKHVEYDIEELRQQAIANLPRNHHWVKQGPYAVCKSCQLEHTQWIGHNLLKVDSEGNYYLEPIRFLPR